MSLRSSSFEEAALPPGPVVRCLRVEIEEKAGREDDEEATGAKPAADGAHRARERRAEEDESLILQDLGNIRAGEGRSAVLR